MTAHDCPQIQAAVVERSFPADRFAREYLYSHLGEFAQLPTAAFPEEIVRGPHFAGLLYDAAGLSAAARWCWLC